MAATRPTSSAAIELVVVLVLAWLGFAALTLGSGGMRLSWDALNHHIYLGWVADQPRFDKDFLPAGYQSLQFPYLYWPVYKLAVAGANAAVAGLVLATFNLLAVAAVWLIARTLMPASTWQSSAMRVIAVALAFMSAATLSLLDASSNDMLAAIPLIWAVALALRAAVVGTAPGRVANLVLLSGLLAGASVAFKFSNGPIAVLLPLFWVFAPAANWTQRARWVVVGCVATFAGALVTYGYWGWQLWRHFGNPIYPFADGLFAPVRAALGWAA